MIEIAGYMAAMLIGSLLGLLGGGGSILAVPVLVYLFGQSPVYATAYSLFIVGLASLIGSVTCMRQGLVSYKTGFVFGIPAIVGVYLTRRFLVPAIPEILFTVKEFTFTKDLLIMGLFAITMVAASIAMIRKKRSVNETKSNNEQQFNYPLILTEGLVVGGFTGLIGAGGGFLIIPALVLLSKLPMKMAVGTSLMIIALKSLIGFTGDISNLEIDWEFLGMFTGLAIIGIFIGNVVSKYIAEKKLKPVFGWFILVMGVYIIGKEIIL